MNFFVTENTIQSVNFSVRSVFSAIITAVIDINMSLSESRNYIQFLKKIVSSYMIS